jgi:hypothetical protein
VNLSVLTDKFFNLLPVLGILVATKDNICQVSVKFDNIKQREDKKNDEARDREAYANVEGSIRESVVLSDLQVVHELEA